MKSNSVVVLAGSLMLAWTAFAALSVLAEPMIVAPAANSEHPALAFRREVVCTGAVTRASLSIVGLGVYEAKINGVRVGEDELW